MTASAKFTKDVLGIIFVPLILAGAIFLFISFWAGSTYALINGKLKYNNI